LRRFDRRRTPVRALATALSLVLAWTPTARLWADVFADTGRAGQTAGRAIAGAIGIPTVSGDVLTLFGGTARETTVGIGELFPGAGAGSAADFSVLFGDSAAVVAAGQAAQASLLTDSSPTGQAYQTLRGSVVRTRPDRRADPLWAQTDAVLDDLGSLVAGFADCTTTTTFTTGERTVHVPDYRTCERLPEQPKTTCVATRVTAADSRTADVALGVYGKDVNTFAFDLNDGSWRLIEPSDGDTFDPPSVAGEVAALGGAFCAAGNWKVRHVGTWDWPAAPVVGSYDASYIPRVLQTPTCGTGLAGQVQLDDDGGSNWYKYGARWRWQFTRLTDDHWEWNTAQCPEWVSRIDGAFCQGTVTCTLNPNSDCLTVAGETFCGAELVAPPASGTAIGQGCAQVTADIDCTGFNQGPMACWTDPQGVEHCPVNAGGVTTDCTTLETDPACAFVRATCVDGAQAASGDCFVWEETWDCGGAQAIPQVTRDSTLACAGPIRCLGTDCLDATPEQSDDFAKAAAALQTAQLMVLDSQCASTDAGGGHYDVHQCTVFGGEAYDCKKAVGGIVDCCGTPDGISLADYLSLILAVGKLDSALMGLDPGAAVRGAWETLRDPAVSTWNAVTDSFASVANNLMGKTVADATDAAAELGLAGFKQAMTRQIAQWTLDVFGEAATNTLFATASGGAAAQGGALATDALQLGGTLGMALSWVMTAYLVYTIAVILVKLLWECEQDEFELGAKRELKSCHYVGSYCASDVLGVCIERRKSYCCFTTPLARILNEQVRPQLGRSWGSAKHPDCAGLAVDELARIDWSRVNLDEWLAILAATGHYPTLDTLNLANLTGAGSEYAVTGTRADAAERSNLRADGLDQGQIRQDAGRDLWGITLPVLP
jgi:conjugal transfer mating pair stabilization protein TraN